MADSTAFEHLFREHYSRLFRYAFTLLNDEEESRDVLNDAFLGAWNHRDSIAADKLPAYLFTGVRNGCLSVIRKRRYTHMVSDATLSYLSAESESAWAEREERLCQIEKQIALLTPRTRYVLEQCYYERRSYHDVAQELGISSDGVKKHITTALKHLRSHFNIDKHKK